MILYSAVREEEQRNAAFNRYITLNVKLSFSFSFPPLVYVLFLIEVISSCDVGVPRESSTLSVFRFGSNSGTQVYLGLENSASCGGYLRNYTICYYNTRTGRPVTSGQLSMWEIGTTSNGLRVYNEV